MKYNDITFFVNSVAPGAVIKGGSDTDKPFWFYNGASFAVVSSLLVLTHLIPNEAGELSLDEMSDENRFVGYLNAPDKQPEEEPPPQDQENSDEEAGGTYGCKWLVENRPDLFDRVTEAVGEVGGFSLTVPRRDGGDRRLYLIETAEKGMQWMRLTARRPAGHGSFVHDDNAVTALAEAVAKLGRHRFPLVLTDAVGEFLAAVAEETGHTFDPASPDLDGMVAKLGPIGRIVGATLHDTANPTMLSAGYKANVIPASAEAVVDCRVLPGRRAAFERELDELLGPGIEREWITELPPYETTFDGDLVDAMNTALLAADPESRIVPYMLSGGTDAKHFARLGIRCFGFTPLRLPPELDFAALFHGVDERIPVDSLVFGTEVLTRFLQNC